MPQPQRVATPGPSLLRSLAVWLLIMSCEAASGVLRQTFLVPGLEPRFGAQADLVARRIAFFPGMILIFGLTLLTIRWMCGTSGRPSMPRLFAVGALWAILTLGFEIGIGRVMAASQPTPAGWPWIWARLAEDYDIRRGGLMAFGLLAMIASPALAARLRRTSRR